MRRRAAEAAAAAALAAVLAGAIAAPVLQAPSARIFGMPIAGDHHDPYTFMAQIDRPVAAGVYLQPVTDIAGAALARATGPAAAYNWIVLATFPLSAAAAYLLARHLALGPAWALMAALLFAFSPFHLAHAAYHPHIAQTQWIPLYLLALWRCLDRPTAGAVAALTLVAAAVTLSNFYGGLIAAVMTMPAAGAYWVLSPRHDPRPFHGLAVTSAALGAVAAAGVGYVLVAAPGVFAHGAGYGAPPDDLVRYGARWWGYLMPAVAHPAGGADIVRAWHRAGVDVGILEQQVGLGWSVVALGLIAAGGWTVRARSAGSSRAVPVLLVVGAIAFVWSLAGGPSVFLYEMLPMFRAYARFGVVVQLMAALLAGMGAELLWRRGTGRARLACLALVLMAAGEYAVWPPAMSRPVVSTPVHPLPEAGK